MNRDLLKDASIDRRDIQKYLIERNYFQTKLIKTPRYWRVDRPIKTIFSVTGNKFINNYTINQILKIDETKLGVNLYKKILASIKNIYKQQGFQKIQIKERIVRKDWKEWVYLKIDEGPRVRIKDIRIEGYFSLPEKTYIKFIKENSTPLIQQGYYNKKDLEEGYSNLIKHLNNQGYLSSKLYSDRVTIKNNQAFITVNLNEGPLIRIENLDIQGNTAFTDEELLAKMKSRQNQALHLNVLKQDLEAISRLYKESGFLQVQVQRTKIVSYKKDGSEARLLIKIQEGKRSRVSKISIEGNDKVKSSLILDLLDFKKGDILTQKKLDQSIESLTSLSLFSRISIQPSLQDPGEILVSLSERKPRRLRGSLGLNTERGLTARLYGEYHHRNFFGAERSLFLKTRTQKNLIHTNPLLEYEISSIYEELFSSRNHVKGTVGAYISKDIFSYGNNQINAVNKKRIGFSIYKKFNHHLNSQIKLWNFENRQESCINNPACSNNTQQIGSSYISLKYDSRDHVFNPKSGTLFSIMAEYSSPWLGSSQDIQFSKLSLQHHIYFSVENYTLACSFRSGFIFSEKFSIPVSRSFLLGGQPSLRGYDGNVDGERIPNDDLVPIFTPNDKLAFRHSEDLLQASGSQYALSKLEFRFPIIKEFKGLLFYDAGVVRLNSKEISKIDLGHSVGFGFRYETLLIPIGLDIAYKLPPKKSRIFQF